ncbi:MAG: glycoside hydrolase family 127 protein, partial [Gammaproteobacteria bacterium]|nr:glycoside hydrolase family 127 protein [Gammaproteobacteria bacterium]
HDLNQCSTLRAEELSIPMPTAKLPATLYLPDRAALAINCLVGTLNPYKDQLPFCLTDLTSSPPRMAHTQFDYSDHTARVIDALLLARAISGSEAGGTELVALRRLFDSGFDDDGLHYTPDNRWSFRHANMHYQRSVINGLLSLSLVEGCERAPKQLANLVDALDRISLSGDGFAYFPSVERMPDGWPRGDWGILGFGVDPANTNGRLIFGLTRSAELLGSDKSAALAKAYAHHVMHHSSAFQADGSFATGMEFREGHFHSRAVTLLGVLRYAKTANDAEALAWATMVFDRALRYGTRGGWFPERIVPSKAHGCETCAVVDMMESAMLLGMNGRTEYWGIAERFLRNQLIESQLTSCDGLEISKGGGQDDEWETTERVVERSVGGFAGWSQPNDLFSKVMHDWDLYTCCSAQGVRGLFNAWTHATTFDDSTVSVNLLINSISAQAFVSSWLPVTGRIEVIPKQDCAVRMRIPEGVGVGDVDVSANGVKVQNTSVSNGYLHVPRVSNEVHLVFSFAVPEQHRSEDILGVSYESHWRGDSIVDISPSGIRVPLYQGRTVSEDSVVLLEKDAPEIGFRLL